MNDDERRRLALQYTEAKSYKDLSESDGFKRLHEWVKVQSDATFSMVTGQGHGSQELEHDALVRLRALWEALRYVETRAKREGDLKKRVDAIAE